MNNEGKLIGLVKLMSEENPLLAEHLMKCKQQSGSSRNITFLSTYFIDKVLLITRKFIVRKIVEEINANGHKFGIEMDTTQDISSKEQCSIVVRYFDGKYIQEKTIAFRECKSTRGEDLFNLLQESLNEINLNICDVIGFSLDGASSMRSSKVGVNHFIKNKNHQSLYIWCFAHRINLCGQIACSSVKAKFVLGLAESATKFIKQSYKRINLWTKVAQEVPNYPSKKKLQLIGQTRWTSKHVAINNIVQTEYHLLVVIKSLILICNMDDIKATALTTASNLLKGYFDYENVICTLLLHEILSILLPTTKKLQSCGLNLADAFNDIKNLYKRLQDLKNNTSKLLQNAKQFIQKLNDLILADEQISGLNLGENLLCIVQKGDSFDEFLLNQIFYSVVNTLLSEIEERFFKENEADVVLFNELRFLNLKILKQRTDGGESLNVSLTALCNINNIQNEEEVVQELMDFETEYMRRNPQRPNMSFFKNIATTLKDNESDYNCNTYHGNNHDNSFDTDNSENESNSINETGNDDNVASFFYVDDEEDLCEAIQHDQEVYSMEKNCSCLKCILKYFHKNANAKEKYINLYTLYKYAAILPITEVKCERDFSKLKHTKNRIRYAEQNRSRRYHRRNSTFIWKISSLSFVSFT